MCRRDLDAFRGGPGRLFDCGGCGGQFVEHALLRELLERREILGSAVPERTPPENPLTQPVRYRPCPACSELMMRRNFGRSSGIIVDLCQKHGTWFDAGELPRVLAFVLSGGLERARYLEQREQRRRELPAPSSPASMSITHVSGDTTLLADLAEAGSALLAHVTKLIGGRP